MAIALDTDFRSLKTGPMTEPAEARASRPGRGEEFARKLAARSDDAQEPDADAVIAVGSPPAQLPQEVAVGTAAAEPASAVDDVPALAEAAKSEIVVDRELALSEVEAAKIERPEVLANAPVVDGTDTGSPDVAASGQQNASAPETASAVAGGAAAPSQDALVPANADAATEAAVAEPDTERGSAAARSLPDALPAEFAGAGDADAEPTSSSEASSASAAAQVPIVPASAPTASSTARQAQTDLRAVGSVNKAPKDAGHISRSAEHPAPAPIGPATDGAALIVSSAQLETGGTGSDPGMTQVAALPGVSSGPTSAAPTAPAPAPLPLVHANGIVTTTPAGVVDIISNSADGGQSDRVVVQLDPPELGRVSIDFKFDAQGLQHVTVTGESPEAVRQLRLLHADLVQTLERHGLGSQNMTFQQQQQNTQQQSPRPNPFTQQAAFATSPTDTALSALMASDNPNAVRSLSSGRLDIRL